MLKDDLKRDFWSVSRSWQ